MFLIPQYVFQRPFYLLSKPVLTHHTIVFGANGAAEIKTGIGMYKQFKHGTKLLFYKAAQFFYFLMRFYYIQLPGHGKVAVDMVLTAILYHPQVVQVYPVGATVGVQYR